MYHREARLHIDAELVPSNCGNDVDYEDFAIAMISLKEEIKPKAMDNISKTQRKQEYYDRKHTNQVYCTSN